MPPDLAEPWRGFLTDLDRLVSHDVRLHCCGGFVVTMLYGLARTTADLDVLSILPTKDKAILDPKDVCVRPPLQRDTPLDQFYFQPFSARVNVLSLTSRLATLGDARRKADREHLQRVTSTRSLRVESGCA